jgi:hypothetical protein
MRRSVIGTEAVTAIVRVIGGTDIIVPITDPTMATTVIAGLSALLASRYQLVVRLLTPNHFNSLSVSNKELKRGSAV